MDLEQLKRFVVAAERGSLTAAARDLHITQSALTQSMKALEHAIGGALFERGARGIRLTALGATLIPRAKAVVNEVGRIRNEALSARNAREARLAVGVAPYLVNNVFPQALDRFLAAMPDAGVTIVEAESLDLARALKHGEIEAAFCGRNDTIAGDPELTFERVLALRYGVMAREGHPVLRRRAPRDSDLREYRWVVYDHEPVEARIREHFAALNAAPPPLLRTNALAVIRALSLATDCIAVLPHDYAAPDIARGELRPLGFSAFNVEGAAGVLTRKDAPRTPAVRRLIAEIVRAGRSVEGRRRRA